MKTINEKFMDDEYAEMVRLKTEMGLNWHDFILRCARLGDNR